MFFTSFRCIAIAHDISLCTLRQPWPGTSLQLVRRCHPVEERAHAGLVDREDDPEKRLLRGRVLQAAGVDRVEAGVPVELLHHVASLVVAAPDVPWPGARLLDLV